MAALASTEGGGMAAASGRAGHQRPLGRRGIAAAELERLAPFDVPACV